MTRTLKGNWRTHRRICHYWGCLQLFLACPENSIWIHDEEYIHQPPPFRQKDLCALLIYPMPVQVIENYQ